MHAPFVKRSIMSLTMTAICPSRHGTSTHSPACGEPPCGGNMNCSPSTSWLIRVISSCTRHADRSQDRVLQHAAVARRSEMTHEIRVRRNPYGVRIRRRWRVLHQPDRAEVAGVQVLGECVRGQAQRLGDGAKQPQCERVLLRVEVVHESVKPRQSSRRDPGFGAGVS